MVGKRKSESKDRMSNKIVVEETNQDEINKIIEESMTEKDIEKPISDKDPGFEINMLKERVSFLMKSLSNANQKILTLNKEIKERNDKLRTISQAYTHLKDNSMVMNKPDEDQIYIKDKEMAELKELLELEKRKTMKNSMYTESVYKKVSELELQLRKKDLELQKMHEISNSLRNAVKERDNSLVSMKSEYSRQFDEERKRIKMNYEKMLLAQKHNELMFRAKKDMEQRRHEAIDSVIENKNQTVEVIPWNPPEHVESNSEEQVRQERSTIPKKGTDKSSIQKLKSMVGSAKSEEIKKPIPAVSKVMGKPTSKSTFNKSTSKLTVDKSVVIKPKPAYVESSATEDIAPCEIEEDTTPSQPEEKKPPLLPYEAHEILPIIKVAVQHGDSTDMIKSSLVSSGYNPAEVDKAISMLIKK